MKSVIWLANLLSEVYKNVAIEPHLQPLFGEVLCNCTASTEENARLYVADGKIFDPLVPL